jgi:hypothetical protein
MSIKKKNVGCLDVASQLKQAFDVDKHSRGEKTMVNVTTKSVLKHFISLALKLF